MAKVDNMQLNNILLATKAFKYLDMHEIELIKAYCKIVAFNMDDCLLVQGKRSKAMYIIIEGKALVVGRVLGKHTMPLGTLDKGDFIGEISLIQRASCPATVIASEEVHCLQLMDIYFEMLSLYFPELRYKIVKAVTEEVCGRLLKHYETIKNIINQSDMLKTTFASKFARFIENTQDITFEDARIDKNDLIKFPFFEKFSQSEIDDILKYVDVRKSGKNCQLIKEGDTETPYYIILRGAVQLAIVSNDKAAKMIVLGPYSIFGSISFVNNQQAILNFITCERAVLLRITEENLKQIAKSNTPLWYKLVDSIGEYFVTLERAASKLIIRLNSELYNR